MLSLYPKIQRFSTVVRSHTKYDAIIIGGGHNGLITSNYLAKAGWKVLILEKRDIIGGAAVTEELIPNYKFSRCSYLMSLFRPQIARDLDLFKHGLKMYKRNPSSFTPLLDNRYLLLGAAAKLNHSEISKFSKKDADNYHLFVNQLDKFVKFLDPLLDEAPIVFDTKKLPFSIRYSQLKNKLKLGSRLLKQLSDIPEFYTILTSNATSYLNKWFECDALKSTLATDAIIGSIYPPSALASNYVLIHHVMGSISGEKGIWAYLEGGMGSLTKILKDLAEKNGVDIILNSPVKSIELDGNKAKAVVLENGKSFESNVIISNTTPYITFNKFLDKLKYDERYSQYYKELNSINYSSPVTKINLAINKLPKFKCLPEYGLHLGTTTHIGSSTMEEIENAYKDYNENKISKKPIIEMTIPSVYDKTLAPEGHYVASLFTQNTPYKPEGKEWTEKMKNDYAERCFDLIEEYAPGFKQSVIFKDILTPPDLERIFGLTGGNIFHGEISLHKLYWNRPGIHKISYMTPIDGLFMCGSGTHPGGGVMGAAGRNCAQVLLTLGKK